VGKETGRRREGTDRCLRNRLKPAISGFSRTRRSQNWSLPGPLEPLKREKPEERLERRWPDVQSMVARKP
jgi:hypothetical protein